MRYLTLLFSLSTVWGASFLFLRIVSSVLGPFVVSFSRLILAVTFLYLYSYYFKPTSFKNAAWKKFFIIGFFNAFLPFSLFAYAEMTLSAALGSILNALTAIFTAFLAIFYLNDKYRASQYVGFAMGILGVVVIVGWHPDPLNHQTILAIIACLVAALSYGIGGVYVSKHLTGTAPMTLAIGQQFAATIIALPFAVLTLPQQFPSWHIVFALVGLGIISTGIAYLIYFHLIQLVGASKTLVSSYLIPFFGILWGFLFLHEPIHLSLLTGLVIILLGVYLINRR